MHIIQIHVITYSYSTYIHTYAAMLLYICMHFSITCMAVIYTNIPFSSAVVVEFILRELTVETESSDFIRHCIRKT